MKADYVLISLCLHLTFVFSIELIDYSDSNKFKDCVNTKSPIDIPYYSSEIDVDFDQFILQHSFYSSINNIQMELEDGAYYIPFLDLDGFGAIYVNVQGKATVKYDLKEVAFHIFSEHTFENKKNELEMQIIHEIDLSTDGYFISPDSKKFIPLYSNTVLVVSILFTIGNNKDSEFLNDLFKGFLGTIHKLDLNQFINFHKGYYYYEGMVTVPGKCDKTATVIVMKKVYPMSVRQLRLFQTLISTYYPNGNALRTDSTYEPKILYVENCKWIKQSFFFLIVLFSIIFF